jgi:hypothetical protein
MMFLARARDNGISLLLQAKVKVEARAYYQIPTAIVMLPDKVFGGNAGFSLATPIGRKDVKAEVDALVTLNLPPVLQSGRSLNIVDHGAVFADPVASAFIGWHHGDWHSNINAFVNIPIGEWERGALANIGFNYWAADATASLTWLDPKVGLELSGAVGVTYNWSRQRL